MIYSHNRQRAPDNSSNTEKLLSILGFILACGLIGGLGALIYGLVRQIPSGVIGGAILTGVSIVFILLLLAIFFFCLKNKNTNDETRQQRASAHRGQQKPRQQQRQHRQFNQEMTSSHEITAISGNQRSEQQQPQRQGHHQHPVEGDRPSMNTGLADSTHNGYGKQAPLSPSKAAGFTYLNQSHGSATLHSQHSQSTQQTK